MRLSARFRHEETANTALLFACALPALLVLMAFVIDFAAMGHKKRELQNASDLAAILAAQNLGAYESTALANLAANGFDTQSVQAGNESPNSAGDSPLPTTRATVEAGTYRPDISVQPELRFTPGTSPINAVRVTATHEAELFFGSKMAAAPQLSARSVAYVSSEAAFTVGTRLLHLKGGIANQILNALLGTDVELSVMDYEDLLDTDVSLFATLDALASEAHLNAVSYEDVLQSDVTLAQLSQAMATVSGAGNRAGHALEVIARDPTAQSSHIQLSGLLELGSLALADLGTINGPYTVRVQALDFLGASAALANGEHQIELDLSADIPGISSLHLTLLVGERPQSSPWLALTSLDSVVVRTAQTRLLLKADIDGLSTLAGTTISLPVYTEVASASARIDEVSCPGGRMDRARVDLLVRPSVANVWIGNPRPANLRTFDAQYPVRRAKLVDTPILDILGRAEIAVGGRTSQKVSFTSQDILNGTSKTVSSRGLAKSLTSSLIGDLELTVRAGRLSITTPRAAQAALAASLDPVSDTLDEVLETVLSIAGVSLGEADVWVTGLACKRAVLVQ